MLRTFVTSYLSSLLTLLSFSLSLSQSGRWMPCRQHTNRITWLSESVCGLAGTSQESQLKCEKDLRDTVVLQWEACRVGCCGAFMQINFFLNQFFGFLFLFKVVKRRKIGGVLFFSLQPLWLLAFFYTLSIAENTAQVFLLKGKLQNW